ncbi:MAG: exosortase/archaeosortase family protein [Verrucomicrobiaceae bacterium]
MLGQTSSIARVLVMLAMVATAGQLFWVLSPSWDRAGYYDFGWLVIPGCAFVFWQRRLEWKGESELPGKVWIAAGLAFLFLLIPLRLSETMDPLWRLPLWVHAVSSLFLFHLLLVVDGGRRMSVACLPATLLCLTAVPLPSMIENPLVDGLTEMVTQAGHSLLLLSGEMVERVGQLLITRSVPLDIAEGCSGIRSFQSSAAAALFLGEICRGAWWQRLVLLAGGLLLAVVGNVFRVFMLGRIANHETEEAVEAAHDPVGLVVLLIVYGGVSFLAWWIHRRPTVRKK